MCNCGTCWACSGSVRTNKGETNPARTAHVPALSASHARADEWVEHADTCRLRESFPLVLACECGGPLAFSPAGHAAITAELVACTLGQRRHADRLELRVDLTGKVMRAVQIVRRAWKVARIA